MTVRLCDDDVIIVDIRPPGFLHGSTAVAGSPNTMVPRRVQVFLPGSARGVLPAAELAATTASDVAGAWYVDGLDPTKKYAVIAYDHTGRYDPVVRLNLTPSVD